MLTKAAQGKVNEIISVQQGIPIQKVTPDQGLIVDFLMVGFDASRVYRKLEDEFYITIPERETYKLETVQDVYDYIEGKYVPLDEDGQDRAKNLIVGVLGVDRSAITPEKRMTEDLGMSSLQAVDLIMALEEEFRIAIPDEDAAKVVTVQHLYNCIGKNRGR